MTELSDKEILRRVRNIYWRRRRHEGLTYRNLAREIGIGTAALYNAMRGFYATDETIEALRNYLSGQGKKKEILNG